MEITEGSLSARLGTALTRLTRLRLRGFGLSIDDYGTGFVDAAARPHPLHRS
jgi:EAL domain-containing protein (putative c-di-GMP-specific phosphodiesterase class I)